MLQKMSVPVLVKTKLASIKNNTYHVHCTLYMFDSCWSTFLYRFEVIQKNLKPIKRKTKRKTGSGFLLVLSKRDQNGSDFTLKREMLQNQNRRTLHRVEKGEWKWGVQCKRYIICLTVLAAEGVGAQCLISDRIGCAGGWWRWVQCVVCKVVFLTVLAAGGVGGGAYWH